MRYLILITALAFNFFFYAQHNNELYNNGALIHVQAGAEVHVLGDVHMRQASGTLHNDGLIKMQGNAYSDNLFQQRGTGTYRVENSNVNVAERQFISGSYAVRGGQAQTGVNDGSFYNLELGNSQGIVYLVGTGNIADVRNSVDFIINATPNRMFTHNIGLTGAIVNPANGLNYTAVFGVMNPTAGLASFIDNTVSTNGNMSGVDNQYVQGKLRRAIAAGGGNYGFVLGVEPDVAGAQRGIQYTRVDFVANSYDVITGYFQSGSSNASPALVECSGNLMNYFGGADHGEWMLQDITGSGTGAYSLNVWPQDDNFIASSPWLITKDNSFQGTANNCGPTPVGLSRSGFNGFNSPSEFDVASTFSPLPVELIKIWAVPNSNHIEVNWDVASEHNVNFYELQRGVDGMNFDYLSNLPASGNSTTELHYTYDDYAVERNQDYYYRYKGVDYNGTFYYSPIVSGRLEGNTSSLGNGLISIYPNPSSADVNFAFTLSSAKEVNMSVYNAVGQIVYSNTLNLEKGITVVPITSNDWSNGLYTIRIMDNSTNETVWEKFIKN